MQDRNGLLKSFMSFSYGSIVTFVLGFITSPVLTRMFSPRDYGIQTLYTSILSMLQLFIIMGVDQSLVRYFYTIDESSRKFLVVRCVRAMLVPAILVMSVLILFRVPFLKLVFGNVQIRLFGILIINLAINTALPFAINVVRLNKHGKIYSNIMIIQKLLGFIITLFVGLTFNAHYYAFLISSVTTATVVLVYSTLAEKDFWLGQLSNRDHLKVTQKELFLFGLPFLPASLIYILMSYVDIYSLKIIAGVSTVGLFSASKTLVVPLALMQSMFTTFWTPVAYEHAETDDNHKDFFVSINNLMVTALVVCSVGLMAFKDVFVHMLGANFRSASEIMPFLIFMPVYYMLTETVNIGLRLQNKLKYLIPINLIVLTLNIIGNITLVPLLGAKGAAMSTGISYVAYYFLNLFISEKFYPVGFHWIKNVMSTTALFLVAAWAAFLQTSIMFYGVCSGIIVIVVLSHWSSLKGILPESSSKVFKLF